MFIKNIVKICNIIYKYIFEKKLKAFSLFETMLSIVIGAIVIKGSIGIFHNIKSKISHHQTEISQILDDQNNEINQKYDLNKK